MHEYQDIDDNEKNKHSASARTEAVRHGWRVLAILSALMGFASISTDLYLPAMPAMGRALRADASMVE
jgi:DHA1 family bicyclomycin/chloramphenicol resistance-like MFS transporter